LETKKIFSLAWLQLGITCNHIAEHSIKTHTTLLRFLQPALAVVTVLYQVIFLTSLFLNSLPAYSSTVFQPVYLDIEPNLGLKPRFLLLSGSCGFLGEGRSKFEVTLRLPANQSVCLGIEHPCGTCDQILLPVGMLLSEICGLISVGRPL
jgi:hypothetical protein